jgi:hypothetical protein
VEHARTAAELHAALERVLEDRGAHRIDPDVPNTPATVARFAEEVGQLWAKGG